MEKQVGKSKTDWFRICALFIAVVFSIVVGYWFQPMVANNSDAVNTVVTIFSILAGFLIAVITLVADPIMQQAKSWEELQELKGTIKRKLSRQNSLFVLYLLTLGAALLMFLVPAEMIATQKYLQMIFLSLATFVFIASFTLPGALMKIQLERYEAELEKTKPQVLKDAKKHAADAVKKMHH